MRHIVYFSLGSNQGKRFENLSIASQSVERYIGKIERASSIYETEPWGFKSSNAFLNQVIAVKTNLDVQEVLSMVFEIEEKLGRFRNQIQQIYIDRTIDIDILFYDEVVMHTPDLIVPHQFIHNRRFVLEPLKEIAPDLIHPVLNQPIKKLLDTCNDNMLVFRTDEKEGIFSKS